jgi:hypothetical protein
MGADVATREVTVMTRRVVLHAITSISIGLLWIARPAVASDAPPTRDALVADSPEPEAQLPRWLWGEWTRDWIQRGRSRSSTLDVRYLQTPTYFADIRILKARSGLAGAKSFADLTVPQLQMLASQNGLAGLTTLVGTVATWSDEISFQPFDGTPDTSRLERRSPIVMHEVGLDGSFTESWRRISAGSGEFLVVRMEHSGRLLHYLVVVGNRFVYVRNRSRDLPTAASLEALIETTRATREQIVEYLDCEFSAGRVHGGSVPWEIQQSTLPWREGRHLEFADQLSVRADGVVLVPKTVGSDRWSIALNTFKSRDIRALFTPDVAAR